MSAKLSKYHPVILVALLILVSSLVTVKYIASKRFSVSAGEDTKPAKVVTSEQSDFALDAGAYGSNRVAIISNFEKGEEDKWTGSGIFDDKIYYEGVRSLSLISSDRKAAVITLEKKVDMASMAQIEFMLNVNDTEAFEAAGIDFGDVELKNYYSYALATLKNGWNLIQIPKDKFTAVKDKDSVFDWSAVEKIRFTSLSRPNSIFLVRLDMLRSVGDLGNYLEQWRATKAEMFLSFYEREGKPAFLARNSGAIVATIKDVEDINEFIFSASVSPQSLGRSGLFIRGNYNTTYGYYFLIGGDKRNNWQLLKRTKAGWPPKEQAIEGVLDNAVFSKDNKYWLRVEAGGDLMEFYLSFDGQQYEKLAEVRDSETRNGGVGIAVIDGGWSLFDEFRFKKSYPF